MVVGLWTRGLLRTGSCLVRCYATDSAILPLSKMRNIGISAHIDSGKTTLTERVLFYTGRIKAMHEVKGKDGVGAKMDSMELEREKGITIKSAATYTMWKGHNINIIDTPGHVDFTIEVERSLRVLDGAVLVLCSVGGVQSQTLTVDRQMRRYNVPQLAFINKCDRPGASPAKVISQLRAKLRRHAVGLQMPMGLEDRMEGVIDLVKMEAIFFEGDYGHEVRRDAIPAKYQKEAESLRTAMLEGVAEVDDDVAELFMNEQAVPVDVLQKAIRKATIAEKLTPVMIGTALKNKGVQAMLDGVLDYLPNPSEVKNQALDLDNDEKPVEIICDRQAKQPFLGLAFKLEENQFGQLTYMRIYQGSLSRSNMITNMRDRKRTRVTRLVRMHSDETEEVNQVHAGEICAIIGLECSSGDSFTDGTTNLAMTSMHVPDPVISLSIKPNRREDLEPFSKALNRFQREDPTFRVHVDDESKETIISGMGELHLEIYQERMRREYKTETTAGKPKVAFRESISRAAKFDYTHKKQTGGSGQYGKVIGELRPIVSEDGSTPFRNEFTNNTIGVNVPPQFIPSIQSGFEEACLRGTLTGHPIVGVEYVLTDGQHHAVDSNDNAFKTAGRQSVRSVYDACAPIILEPIMAVEVTVPEEYQGVVIGGLNRRKGVIVNSETNDGTAVLECEVPLNNMFGYSTELRTQTSGKGEFSMEYLKHSRAMRDVQEELVKIFEEERRKKESGKK